MASHKPQAQAPGKAAGGSRKAGARFSLRNWRVRSKLVVLVVIPTIAALTLGGLRAATSIATANEYAQVNEVAVLASELTGLAHEVESERDLTAMHVAQGRRGGTPSNVKTQYERVDKLVTDVRGGIEALTTGDSPHAA